jgi:hypothetical protein
MIHDDQFEYEFNKAIARKRFKIHRNFSKSFSNQI